MTHLADSSQKNECAFQELLGLAAVQLQAAVRGWSVRRARQGTQPTQQQQQQEEEKEEEKEEEEEVEVDMGGFGGDDY